MLVVVSLIFWALGLGPGILNAVLVSMEKSDFVYIIPTYSNFSGTHITRVCLSQWAVRFAKQNLPFGLCLPHPALGQNSLLCPRNTEAITYPLGRYYEPRRSISNLSGER